MNEVQAEHFKNTLRLTDQGLQTVEKFTEFKSGQLKQKATVLNIGGGFTQRFEKELKEKRPDVGIFTVDPSVFETNYHISLEKGKLETYKGKDRVKKLSNKENTVVALGGNLPLKTESIDEAVDFQATSQYSRDEESYKSYLLEVMRILKPGGRLHIVNVFYGDILSEDPKSEADTVLAAKKIFSELGLDAKVYVVNFSKKVTEPDKRVCATITKR